MNHSTIIGISICVVGIIVLLAIEYAIRENARIEKRNKEISNGEHDGELILDAMNYAMNVRG